MPENETASLSVKFTHAFSLKKEGKTLIASEQAETVIGDEAAFVTYESGTLSLLYRDILRAGAENYRVKAFLKDGAAAEFYYLGHDFDSFSECFLKQYNAVIKKDSFMGEEAVCVKRGARFEHTGSVNEAGECDLSLGKHALIVVKLGDAPARLPFALIDAVEYRTYDFTIMIYGDRWTFSMLGHEYGGFQTQYAKCLKILTGEAAEFLMEAKSDLDAAAANAAASLFLDGRPVPEAAAEKLAPGLWHAVLEEACKYGFDEYFRYLDENAAEKTIGFKESLMTSQGKYIWMLARLGNCIVFEAASSTKAGMATYLFTIKNSFAETAGLINYCMHMTEFRREPVYFTDEELQKPENAGYLDAVRRVPQIRQLRKLYRGRLMHTSPEKWIKGLEAL